MFKLNHHPRKFFKLLLAIGLFTFLFAPTANALDVFMPPVFGDITGASGIEHVVVEADGGLALFGADGTMQPGFPITTINPIIGTPVITNLIDDAYAEIAVLTEQPGNGSDIVEVYSGAGVLIASKTLTAAVDFAPVAVASATPGVNDLLVAEIDGDLVKLSYSRSGPVVSASVVRSFGEPVAVSTNNATSVAQTQIVVVYLTRPLLQVYSYANWGLTTESQLDEMGIYQASFDGQAEAYSVAQSGSITAVNITTGAKRVIHQGSLRANANSIPVSAPLLAEMNAATPGQELLVQASDGTLYVLSQQGQIIARFSRHLLGSTNGVAYSSLSQLYRSVFNFSNNLFFDFSRTVLTSEFSRMQSISDPQTTRDIAVFYNGQEIQSGETITIPQSLKVGMTSLINLDVRNLGQEVLVLNGNPRVSVGGADAQSWQVTTTPDSSLAPQSSSSMALTFTALGADGQKNAIATIPSNDPDEPAFVVNLSATVSNNYIVDGNMEAIDTAAWRNWSVPPVKEKSIVQSVSPERSLHVDTRNPATGAGVQQINIAGIQAGHSYRLSYNYMLTSGEFKQLVGIRTSNNDFENRTFTTKVVGNTWKSVIRDFTVPQGFVSDLRVVFSVRTGEFYLDDVYLQEVPAITNVVTDGNMELNDLNPWIKWGSPGVLQKSLLESVSPVRSLYVDTRVSLGGGVQQLAIPVRAGKSYRLSFRYKLLSGNLRQLLGIKTSNSDFEGKPFSTVQAGGAWQLRTRDFTVPQNFVGDFRLVFTLRAGEVFLDDVSIVELP